MAVREAIEAVEVIVVASNPVMLLTERRGVDGDEVDVLMPRGHCSRRVWRVSCASVHPSGRCRECSVQMLTKFGKKVEKRHLSEVAKCQLCAIVSPEPLGVGRRNLARR